MAGNDDIPDYMRGVEQAGFDEPSDGYTLRPDTPGSLTPGYSERADFGDRLGDEDDDEDDEGGGGLRRVLILLVGMGVVLMAGVLLLGAMVGASATMVRDARFSATTSGKALVDVVIEQRKIVSELGSRGGNRVELERMLASMDAESGIEKSLTALAYTYAVQAQIVAIGDLRNTPVQRRQHALDLAQDTFEADLASWRSSAGNPLGQMAVASGLAEPPPP